MGISLALLAYKEEENLRILLPEIRAQLEKTGEPYEILVIDTEKPFDNTRSVCEENGALYYNQEYPRFGGAFKTAIKYAKMDKFLIMDSDGSHNPKYIPDIYEKFVSGSYDVVIGSRYVKGGVTHDAKSSIIMSKVLNGVFRFCLGIKAKDISTDYRMYKTELLKNVSLVSENYDVLQEVLLKIKQYNHQISIGEVPISFEKRLFGESKRNLIPFIISYIRTLIRLTFLRILKNDKKSETAMNFVIYAFFGVLALGVDFGVFSAFNLMLEGKYPEISSVIGNVVGFLFTFFTNTYLNFKKTDRFAYRLVSYATICVFGMLISTFFISLFKTQRNIYVVKLIIMLVVCVIQFVLNKFITYRK